MPTELGLARNIDLLAVRSHDTASAVVAVPATTENSAYNSCGTWGLVGVELDHPITSDAARAANFTNEGGVDGRVRFLHNVMGLWLLSESVRTWESEGHTIDLPSLLDAAATVSTPIAVFDANDPSLRAPGDMPARVAQLCRQRSEPVPASRTEFVRSIIESLADAFAAAVRTASELSGKRVDVIHLVGGGSQNDLLCQLVADRSGLPVMLSKLRSMKIIDPLDVDAVMDAWLTKSSHNTLYSHIKASRDVFWTRWNAAVDESDDLEKGRLEEFRGTVFAFVRAYDFLSQIMNYDDTDIEKWAIFLRVYRRVIERQDADPAAINTDDIVLTHYRLRRLDAQNLGLTSGRTGDLAGITAAGSAQPREAKYGLLQDVIDKINRLFAGTDVDEINGVSAAETILRHVVDNPKIQAEARANTPIDFETSPTIVAELEDVIYASAAGHSNAMKTLLQKSDFASVVGVLVAMGLYEKTRSEAERTARTG